MKVTYHSRKSRVIFVLWLIEVALIMIALEAATWVRLGGYEASYENFVRDLALWPRALTAALFVTGAMAAFDLYEVHNRHKLRDLALRLGLSFAFGSIALFVLYYLVPATYIGRGILIGAMLLAILMIFGLRMFLQHVFDHEHFKRRVLVLGAGHTAAMIESRLRRRSDRLSFYIVGYRPVAGQSVEIQQSLLLEENLNLQEAVQSLNVHEIVVAMDERRGNLPMRELLACAQSGVRVTDLPAFFEREAGLIKLNIVEPSALVFSGGFDHSMPRILSKRCFDLAVASVLLLASWPVMLLVALSIRLESRGPVLYRQVRVGEGGKTFNLVKFRSMREDAESDGVARWASHDDDRTTRVGAFIRKTRLDELPQLFNVLRGEMSFVGPRPERPQFVDQLNQEIRYYDVRHSVKPGLTGWAQLRYPYGASVRDAEEKLKFDLFYVKNQDLLFDLMIMLQTVEVVMFRRGAR